MVVQQKQVFERMDCQSEYMRVEGAMVAEDSGTNDEIGMRDETEDWKARICDEAGMSG